MVDFQFPELPVFQRLKKIVDEHQLGVFRHAHVTWHVESWAHRQRIWSWKTDAKLGGGVVSLLGSHVLYIAEWLFGGIRRLWASSSNFKTQQFAPVNTIAAEDEILFQIEFPGNKKLSATLCNSSPGSTIHEWRVVFENGTVVLSNPGKDYMANFSMEIIPRDGQLEIIHYSQGAVADGRLAPFRTLASRFLTGVTERIPQRPDFSDGTRVQVIMDAVRASARENTIVDIGKSVEIALHG